MISPMSCVAALWTVWFVGWWLAALATTRTVARQSVAARLAHSVFLWGGAILLFAQPRRLGILLRPLVPASLWVAWGGVAAVVLGLGYTAWARLHLGRFWSGMVTLKEGHALVRSGPYALTRHPIYTGLLLALAGTALVRDTPAGLAGLVLLVAGAMIKIRQEERILIGHFGAAYRAYQAEVPGVVPRFRSGRSPTGA